MLYVKLADYCKKSEDYPKENEKGLKMSSDVLFSIITVTYNLMKSGRENCIIQNIESVRNQSFKNFEHIIIDGASDDGTLELLKPYEEKGWITVYSAPDKGIYDAMNSGLHHARGKYISYLNSDDFYHDRKGLEEVAKVCLNQSNDFVYSECNIVNLKGKCIGFQKPVPETFYVRILFLIRPFL